jgi:hypothetical protein
MTPSSNGLGEWMQLANLSVVGAMILTIVVCTIFLVTKGIPKAVTMLAEFVDSILKRHEASQSEQRQQFISALDNQARSRAEAAKQGHDVASRIADNLADLTDEVREANGHPKRRQNVAMI